jgi:hypothetical protein
VELFNGLNTQLCRFIDTLSHHLFEVKYDVWSHVFLKLLIGESPFRDLFVNKMHESNDFQLNMIFSLIELLGPRCEDGARNKVTLAL